MTETPTEYTEPDQIMSLVATLRSDVQPVLAPKLAYHVDLACRLIEGYRLRERNAKVIKRQQYEMDDSELQRLISVARCGTCLHFTPVVPSENPHQGYCVVLGNVKAYEVHYRCFEEALNV